METLYAWERQKFVVIVSDGKILSPWYLYHCTKLVDTLDDAIKTVRTFSKVFQQRITIAHEDEM